MKQNLAKVNDRLFVGNKLACGLYQADICLHINRSDRPDKDCCRHPYAENFHLDYRDGDLLTAEHLETIDKVIAAYPGKTLLVHCNAGGCRSVAVASYILTVTENLHPLDASYAVERAVYDQRGKLCNLVYQPKAQLIAKICQMRGVESPN